MKYLPVRVSASSKGFAFFVSFTFVQIFMFIYHYRNFITICILYASFFGVITIYIISFFSPCNLFRKDNKIIVVKKLIHNRDKQKICTNKWHELRKFCKQFHDGIIFYVRCVWEIRLFLTNYYLIKMVPGNITFENKSSAIWLIRAILRKIFQHSTILLHDRQMQNFVR